MATRITQDEFTQNSIKEIQDVARQAVARRKAIRTLGMQIAMAIGTVEGIDGIVIYNETKANIKH